MLKTSTLNKRIDKQLSETEGTATFYITDEKGDARETSGSTLLNENKLPQGVTS